MFQDEKQAGWVYDRARGIDEEAVINKN